MRGIQHRNLSRKRWTLTWALLLSAYMAIGSAPTAYAAATACATSNGTATNDVLNVTLNGDAWVDFFVAAGDVDADITVDTENSSGCEAAPYEDIRMVVVTSGAGDLSETVTLHDAGSADWELLTGGISVAMGGGTVDEVYLWGGPTPDEIDAGALLTSLEGVETVVLWGEGDADVLTGADGVSNHFWGRSGTDTMIGGDSDDIFLEGNSADADGDTIIGGGGSHDLVDYVHSGAGTSPRTLPVVVDLDSSSMPDPDDVSGSEDDFDGTVEDVLGTAFNDEIVGSAVANVIEAGWGADFVRGAGGADIFIEGTDDASGDTIKGDVGTDLVDYSGRASGVVIDLDPTSSATACDVPGSEDVFDATVENAIGSASGDLICGTSGSNQFAGGDGGDTIEAIGGSDLLRGGNGSDTLLGGAGSDRLYGDAGIDSLDGGAGSDTLYARGDSATDTPVTGGADKDVCNLDSGPETTGATNCENLKPKK